MKDRARAVIIAMFLAASSSPALSRIGQLQLVCLSPGETRETIQAQKLIQPFRALAEASRSGAGESIGIKLCRFNALTVYDVMLLRHDGHVIHLLVDAANGSLLQPAPVIPPAPVVSETLPPIGPLVEDRRPMLRAPLWRFMPLFRRRP